MSGGNGAGRGNGKGNGNGKANGEITYDPFDHIDYPCRFEIKAMGARSNRFDALVQQIVSRHIESADLLASLARNSRHGKYVSITCIILARSKQQIRAIYADLAACPEVLMTL
jgi:uncharacterized protein